MFLLASRALAGIGPPMATFKAVGWVLTIVSVGIGWIGNWFGWYHEWVAFDEVVHSASFFSMTLLIGAYAHDSLFRYVPGYGIWKVLLVASAGIALGVMWELAEWLYDLSVTGNVIKDKRDTMVDFVCDSGGALAASLVALGVARAAAIEPGGRRAAFRESHA